jgi:diacylglycerol kinase family enzyme
MTAFAGGEPVGALPVTVEALPGALTVLVGA